MKTDIQTSPTGLGASLWAAFLEGVSGLHPAYFAMVMATGVLGVACRLLGLRPLSEILFWINLPAYFLLGILTLLRMVAFPRRFLADWSSHQRGPGFFTTVAATCVVGLQMVVQRQDLVLARNLWWAALALWVVCMYSIFAALTVKEEKPPLEDGINGGWLTAVVATQSLCVLGCLVTPALNMPLDAALFLMTSLWLCGGMLYIWLISLIFYRYTFLRFLPSDLMPPYWINMGAMAISALAGTMLIKHADGSPLLASLLPFLKGFTLLYWATASWWIPMLLILGIWRHYSRKVPLTYDPLYWGAVFPLAMYTSCTYRLAEALNLPFLMALPRWSIAVALTAWLLTFLGLMLSLFHSLLLAFRPWMGDRKAQGPVPKPPRAATTSGGMLRKEGPAGRCGSSFKGADAAERPPGVVPPGWGGGRHPAASGSNRVEPLCSSRLSCGVPPGAPSATHGGFGTGPQTLTIARRPT